jgi:hypothetical protein
MAALRQRTATGRASCGDLPARKALIRRCCIREARCAANPHEPGNAADHVGAYEVTNAAGHFGKYVIGAGTGSEHWCRRPGLRGSPIRRGLSLASPGYCGVGCGRRVKTGLRSPETADRLALAHAIVAVGGALDELEVVGDLDERPLVAGQVDGRAGTQDGVDPPPAEAELGEVRRREERLRRLKELGRGTARAARAPRKSPS